MFDLDLGRQLLNLLTLTVCTNCVFMSSVGLCLVL
jgi:hypothetical protein